MNITIRKSPATAGEMLVDILVNGEVVPQTWEGYQVIPASDVPELQQAWGVDAVGLRRSGVADWARRYERFGRWEPTDPLSFYRGAPLPCNGFCAVNCGDFAVVAQQVITDIYEHDWVWRPIYVLGSAD